MRIACYQPLDVCERILLGARWAPRWLDDLPCHHSEIAEPRQRPVPKVFKLAPQDVAGLHRQVRVFPFEGLHARQLIQADGPLSLLRSLGSLRIHLTALADLLVPLGIGNLG